MERNVLEFCQDFLQAFRVWPELRVRYRALQCNPDFLEIEPHGEAILHDHLASEQVESLYAGSPFVNGMYSNVTIVLLQREFLTVPVTPKYLKSLTYRNYSVLRGISLCHRRQQIKQEFVALLF